MGIAGLLTLVSILGGSSFLAGMLPLTVSLSKKRLAQLSTVGTGLLLGAAMGVIIPEGVEATYDAIKPTTDSHTSPSTHIAFSLLSGFTLMFLLEQLLAPVLASRDSVQHAQQKYAMTATSSGSPLDSPTTPGAPDLDMELELELNALGIETREKETRRNPRMMTLGLVIHSLADGLALGAANALTVASDEGGGAKDSVSGNAAGLSFIVFVAIAVHKAPTALALTSSLVSQLSPRKIRQHLIAFSLASPVSALATYFFLTFFGGVAHIEEWTGTVLMFSGGTFLYVATVLSSLPSHSHSDSPLDHDASQLSPASRAGLTVLGMFVPVVLSALVGHGH